MKNLFIALATVMVSITLCMVLFIDGAQTVSANDGWLIIWGVSQLILGVLALYFGVTYTRHNIRKYVDTN